MPPELETQELSAELLQAAQDNDSNKYGAEDSKPAEEPETPAEGKPAEQPASEGSEIPGGNGAEVKPEVDDFVIDEKLKADIKAGKLIPQYRFNEVGQRLKAYESFGSPEELRAKLERLNAPSKKEESEPETEDEKNRKYIADQLLKPEIAFIKRMEAKEKAATESFYDKTYQKVNEFIVKELGFDKENQAKISIAHKAIANYFNDNPDLAKRFYEERDMSAVDDAIAEFKKDFLQGAQRSAKAEIIAQKSKTAALPRPIGKGGIPEGRTPKSPESMTDKEAGEYAYEVFNQSQAGQE